MRLKKFGLALALTAGLLPAISHAEDKVRLVVSSQSIAFVTYLTATAMGYFDKVGLAVEPVKMKNGTQVVAAVLGGSGDVGLVPPPLAAGVRNQGGGDVVMFGALSNNFTANIVFSKEWAAAKNIDENSSMEARMDAMRGARVGVSGPGSSEAIIRRYAKKGGMDPDRDLQIIALGEQTAILGALIAGHIDAMSISPPHTTQAVLENGAFIAFNHSAGMVPEFVGYPHIIAFAHREWLEANPSAAEKLSQGFQMALNAIGNESETLIARDKVRAEYYPTVSAEVFEAVWADVIKGAGKDLRLTEDMLKMAIELERVTSPNFDIPDMDKAYTNEFADKVAPK